MVTAIEGATPQTWKVLLAAAVRIFDDLEDKGFGAPDVVLGGGTVLMLRLAHRLSNDIDLFLHDVQWLSLLTPRLNEFTSTMAADYVEQANSVKLIMPEGDIDFIAAGSVTDTAADDRIDFMGRSFALESSAEILAKKLLYRAEYLKPRDVFDLIAVAETDADAAACAIASASSKRGILKRRIAHLMRLPADELARDILPLGEFARIIPGMAERALGLVDGRDSP
jgi:predicted nucleotidyltransferase component of viral defense system